MISRLHTWKAKNFFNLYVLSVFFEDKMIIFAFMEVQKKIYGGAMRNGLDR